MAFNYKRNSREQEEKAKVDGWRVVDDCHYKRADGTVGVVCYRYREIFIPEEGVEQIFCWWCTYSQHMR